MGRPIRLVQLVHGYPPAVGGVEISVRDLCERLVNEYDFQVTVLTTNAYTVGNFADPTLPTIPIQVSEVQNGVSIRRFPVVTRWVPFARLAQSIAWKLRLPGNGQLRTWYHGPVCPQMLHALRELRPDVICAASFPLNHMRYPFLLGRDAPPVVLLPSAHPNQPWAFERPNLLRLVNRAYTTIAHTAFERDWLIARGAKPEKVCVIGHGVDPTEFRPRFGFFRAAYGIPPDAVLISYLGQQGAYKGIDTLIAVFPELLKACPSAWLAVAGARTPYSTELRQIAAKLPVSATARFTFLDEVTEQEKADFIGDCDVFASPSQAESFGITTLEAWALGKPVVVGDSPAQREIVENGQAGLVVRHGNKIELLKALRSLAENQPLREALGSKGHKRLLEHFGRRAIEGRYAAVFKEAALSKGARS